MTRILQLDSGNPLRPFTALYRQACEMTAAEDLAEYHFNEPSASNTLFWKYAQNISGYFTNKGIKAKDWSGIPFSHMLFVDGGATRCYELTLLHLRQRASRIAPKKKPAIIMPSPTYGMLLYATEDNDFDIITIPRDIKNGGAVKTEDVLNVLRKAIKTKQYIAGYFDITPDNPMGHIRSKEQTQELAKIFMAFEQKVKKKMKKYKFHVIEDRVYDELQYDPADEAFSFASIEDFYPNTFIITSPSKAGLSGVRAGLIIGEDAEHLTSLEAISSFHASTLTAAITGKYFSNKPEDKKLRDEFMHRANAHYAYSGTLLKTLINGLDTESPPPDRTLYSMVWNTAEHYNISPQEALDRLKNGLKYFKIVTSPKAGFFHLLDMTAIKGKKRKLPNKNKTVRILGYHDLSDMFYDMSMRAVEGSAMGMKDDFMARITFSMPIEDIFETAERFKTLDASIA